ncbi:MAG: hypothetical protein AB1758_36805, partial [Candidatus Eremiobacterota bacterium]
MILRTKLRPAFIRPRVLARQRLLSHLAASRHARLVLLHAEAGAGKSCLIFDYLRRSEEPFAWYSLDAD